MTITAQQCRAARGLLGWSQQELAAQADMGRATIADFELGTIKPMPHTLAKITAALEQAGVRFIEAEEGITGPGVALKWGAEVTERQNEGQGTRHKADATQKAVPWDDNFAEDEGVSPEVEALRTFWREHPHEWAALHDVGRRALLQEMRLPYL